MKNLSNSPSYSGVYAHLEDLIVSEYKRVQSLRKVKQKFGPKGPSHETIAKILKTNNIPLRKISSWEKLENKEQNSIAQSYNGENINELANTYSVCPQTIIRILKKNNINPEPRRKYKINMNSFDIINSDSAYWLGYLFGRAHSKSDYHIEIAFTTPEQNERVEELRKFLKTTQPIKEIKMNREDKVYIQQRLILGSKTLSDKLKKLGVNVITHIEYPDYIANDMTPHFIRGIFDARGRFSTKDNMSMIFVANPKFLSVIAKIIEKETEITGTLVNTSENRAKLIYSDKEVINRIVNYMCPKNVKVSKLIGDFIK